MKKLDGPFLPPLSGKAKQLVILLHGYGDSGNGLIGIGQEWAEGLPDAAFVAPHGPEPCESWPSGYQWFSLRAAEGISTGAFERGNVAKQPAAILNAFIDEQLKKWSVDDSALAVGGFSQGAMMAMYTMPRRKNPCAAVVGYSGLLVDAEGLKAPGIVKPTVLAIHGAEDEVVIPQSLEGVKKGFSAAGFDVETVLRPHLGHSIDEYGLMHGLRFLQKHFGIAEKKDIAHSRAKP